MKRRRPNANVIYPQWPSSECHTPEWLLSLAHDVLGEIDLDPATDDRNRARAARYFTKRTNGLTSEWAPPGRKPGPVWLNFPFGKESPLWTAQLIFYAGFWNVPALCLAPARVGARWYRTLTESAQLVCELDGRILFEGPDGQPFRDKHGRPSPARWGCVLCFFGPDRARARRLLQHRGSVRYSRALPRTPGRRDIELQIALERRGQLRLVT